MKQVINPQPIEIDKIKIEDVDEDKIYIAFQSHGFIHKLHMHYYKNSNIKYYLWDVLNNTKNCIK